MKKYFVLFTPGSIANGQTMYYIKESDNSDVKIARHSIVSEALCKCTVFTKAK